MMKRLIITLLVNMVLAVALVSGVVLENHHHDANGVLCVSSCGTTSACGHSDDCGSEGSDPADCSLHLDTFCCDGSNHHHGSDGLCAATIPVALMPWQAVVPQDAFVPLEAWPGPDVSPAVICRAMSDVKRRGPPAV